MSIPGKRRGTLGTLLGEYEEDHTLDDFDVLKTVGTGTFGRVCVCRDKSSGQYRALKVLAIEDLVRLKQVEHCWNEKNILQQVHHPFIVDMLWHHHDDSFVYMLFDYVCGGELFSYLRSAGRFPLATAVFYATEIISALAYLHSMSIVYRDVKPENLLLDRDGHLKITDFGFSKVLSDRTWTLCGTPEYLAPEIILGKGHNKAVDWWALGILIYEMLAGHPPFFDENPFGIYEKILCGQYQFPRYIDGSARDLIKRLLVAERTRRLGAMKNGAEDIKRHKLFRHIIWDDVYEKKTQPPIVPKVSYDGDTRNFDDYPEKDWQSTPAAPAAQVALFADF
ncbi:cAMP-dependent protein kinase catalytic subunit 3 [Hyalella azteca]|uniref:cAMP-dependent protein kinase catalytic subunit 3 n=1 Tax=Hyalella azteca TaxID=294128 RepID=A0A8B7PBT0_HYAAZ|nr:cAMP-dependent protein kinase catalytic subunit 3 [Hyalella azteca]